ncbi:hypothetical protein FNV43_RR20890 [Rhamnella rubrinervis]|uniref:Uncharacterized protein n=1 Tax=Rhamnella rubrinervis TaxID=2594499 RepID=A0A8K0E1L4_9ROSA|nr:hypothetical protein FNV43_RR20890 [Rhamnella rubrinervis]
MPVMRLSLNGSAGWLLGFASDRAVPLLALVIVNTRKTVVAFERDAPSIFGPRWGIADAVAMRAMPSGAAWLQLIRSHAWSASLSHGWAVGWRGLAVRWRCMSCGMVVCVCAALRIESLGAASSRFATGPCVSKGLGFLCRIPNVMELVANGVPFLSRLARAREDASGTRGPSAIENYFAHAARIAKRMLPVDPAKSHMLVSKIKPCMIVAYYGGDGYAEVTLRCQLLRGTMAARPRKFEAQCRKEKSNKVSEVNPRRIIVETPHAVTTRGTQKYNRARANPNPGGHATGFAGRCSAAASPPRQRNPAKPAKELERSALPRARRWCAPAPRSDSQMSKRLSNGYLAS